MAHVFRLDPDGTVTTVVPATVVPATVVPAGPSRVLEAANKAFAGDVGVVQLAAPIFDDGLYVGCVHDSGLLHDLPLNRHAWALYGRSPVYGPMFIARDDGDPIPDAVTELMFGDPKEWMSDYAHGVVFGDADANRAGPAYAATVVDGYDGDDVAVRRDGDSIVVTVGKGLVHVTELVLDPGTATHVIAGIAAVLR